MAVATTVGRTVTTVQQMPALRPRAQLAARLGLLATCYLLLLLAALLPARWLLLAAAASVAALEVLLGRLAPDGAWLLDTAGAGPEMRLAVRAVALTAFAARAASTSALRGVVTVLVAVIALQVVRRGLRRVVTYLQEPPLQSRGLTLRCPPPPPAPPRWATEPWLTGVADLPFAIGLALASNRPDAVMATAAALSVVVAAAPVVILTAAATRLHRRQVRTVVADAVRQGLLELAPEVVLYFAGTTASSYQVEMWLEPVERLNYPTVVLVRDRGVLAALAPTKLPVVCVPHNATLMALEIPSLHLALYVSNAAGNIHLLRRRGVWSVFVGHGDSDKEASASPFTRVYDEIWVAGPAGGERYARAGIGIPPDRIVEVGRPQLLATSARQRAPGAPVTILYAPTWEGWGDEANHSSLLHLGSRLVRVLLDHPNVVVHYRPHPLTGSRDARVRRAHQEIVELLRAGVDRHRSLLPSTPSLPACFAVTDGLVTDVSSVVTDFLGTDRPFAILDSAGLGAREFRQRYPAARGGFVIGPELAGLDTFLTAAAGEPDPSATARRAVRHRLLGCQKPDGDARFRAAVERLLSVPHPTRQVPALYSQSR
jgi:hypothetical protein